MIKKSMGSSIFTLLGLKKTTDFHQRYKQLIILHCEILQLNYPVHGYFFGL